VPPGATAYRARCR